MAILLDNGNWKIEPQDMNIVLYELKERTNRETGELYQEYANPKYFNNPAWLFVYMLRKKICSSDAATLDQLRQCIIDAERHVVLMAKDIALDNQPT